MIWGYLFWFGVVMLAFSALWWAFEKVDRMIRRRRRRWARGPARDWDGFYDWERESYGRD